MGCLLVMGPCGPKGRAAPRGRRPPLTGAGRGGSATACTDTAATRAAARSARACATAPVAATATAPASTQSDQLEKVHEVATQAQALLERTEPVQRQVHALVEQMRPLKEVGRLLQLLEVRCHGRHLQPHEQVVLPKVPRGEQRLPSQRRVPVPAVHGVGAEVARELPSTPSPEQLVPLLRTHMRQPPLPMQPRLHVQTAPHRLKAGRRRPRCLLFARLPLACRFAGQMERLQWVFVTERLVAPRLGKGHQKLLEVVQVKVRHEEGVKNVPEASRSSEYRLPLQERVLLSPPYLEQDVVHKLFQEAELRPVAGQLDVPLLHQVRVKQTGRAGDEVPRLLAAVSDPRLLPLAHA